MPIVHIVDDNCLVRESIGFILADAEYAVRDYASPKAFLRRLDVEEDGCVIADLHMPEMSGLVLLDKIKQSGAALPTILMTGDASVESIVSAMRRGAIDVIFKPLSSATILATVQAALENPHFDCSENADAEFCREKLASLVPPEKAILAQVLQGRSVQEIASELGLTAHGVLSHHSNIMTKIGARSLPDLVRKSLLGANVQ